MTEKIKITQSWEFKTKTKIDDSNPFHNLTL